MFYKSTRNNEVRAISAQVIYQGLSADGGLFVPDSLPKLEMADIETLSEMSYADRAVELLSVFLTDFPDEMLTDCVYKAYQAGQFHVPGVTGISCLPNNAYLLELWHGPTCAFKDMALQLLPHLLTSSAKLLSKEEEIVILVATSGDTGKAALEGFRDVPGTKVAVFYPDQGVSPMQKRQMTSQEGENVYVCAIKGNFDDAQTAVKTIFTDTGLAERMAAQGKVFSSANSINVGRLVPQIVYYVSAYADLLREEKIKPGDEINVCVPTGNFGNILAAYYAKEMGVPIHKLICASNENRVLTDFIRTGTYDRNRPFHTTLSPSMDILISSNLERLLYHLAGEDDGLMREWFGKLKTEGKYTVNEQVKEALQTAFYGGYCTDDETKETIARIFAECGYLCDTHTAVGVKVWEDYRKETGDDRPTVIASTANPYKFSASVLSALKAPEAAEERGQIEELSALTGVPVPEELSSLWEKPIRFDRVIDREAISAEVTGLLGL